MSKQRPTVRKGKAAQQAQQRGGPLAAIAGVAVAIFAIVAIVWIWEVQRGAAAQSAAASSPTAASAATPSGPAFPGIFYPSQGHAHLDPGVADDFKYNSNPPTSGPHKEIFSDQFVNPNPLPVWVQVHLLEHGNVLLQYSCTCPDVAASLSSIAYDYDSKLIAPSELQPSPGEVQTGEEVGKAVIVAPNPSMKAKIALTAWTRLATLQSVDKQKVESFIGLYLNNSANASQ